MPASFPSVPIEDLVAQLSNEEQVLLLTGFNMWKTHAIPRLGIPGIIMTDGTYGVRYSVEQIDNDERGGQDIDAFLNVVNQRAIDVESSFGMTKAATCFSNGSSLGCSWDVDLARAMGNAMANECRNFGVHLLLGPGINLRRNPLGGRSYEYYSEDPVVAGDIAAALIDGLQQNGVGASLKHFACNNSEMERTTMDSVVEERALREIYLLGFERAIEKSNPWTVMSSYNRLNGVQAAENKWLLDDVLRGDFGFEGLVISDWHAVKDRVQSLRAGTDLDMPETETRKKRLLASIESGEIELGVLERSCRRVLELVKKALDSSASPAQPVDLRAHHELARRAAVESIVLLKNNGVLPLDASKPARILVVGENATTPVFQGSGCATTRPSIVDSPLQEIEALVGRDSVVEFVQGTSMDGAAGDALREKAVNKASSADVVVVFVSTEVGYDGEGSDRRDLALSPGHDALVADLAKANANVIVVLSNPDAVAMPWLGDVAAVLETFFAGQGVGHAIAQILFGISNPCGKLSATFPKQVQDIPGFPTYPGENGRHVYCEGIHVGYRHYDLRNIEPLFPFGFGLSYTTFDYSNLRLGANAVRKGEGLRVTFDVTNVGERAGKEIAQLYIEHGNPRLRRSPRDLRGFVKFELAPGETKTLEIELAARDFEVYDTLRKKWVLDRDTVKVRVGRSSRDLPLAGELQLVADEIHRPVTRDAQAMYVIDNPIARPLLVEFVCRTQGISSAHAERLLEHCRHSFLGLFATFDRRLRADFDDREIDALIREINDRMASEAI